MSDVGIVVITRNRRERVLATLGRLAALPERPPIVVVDNDSADGTAEAVRAQHREVQVLRLDRNRGATARTLGAAALDLPYVAFSDDDSWWESGALGAAAALFGAHPRLGLIAAATRVGPANAEDPLNAVLRGSRLGTAPDLPGPSVLGFLACASVVRREAFLQAGGFHPVLHFGAEETLLALDLAAAGWGVAYCQQIVAHHDPDPGPRPGRTSRVRRNDLLTTVMRRPWRAIRAESGQLTRNALRDHDARRALASALPLLPAALRARTPLPGRVERDLQRLTAPLP